MGWEAWREVLALLGQIHRFWEAEGQEEGSKARSPPSCSQSASDEVSATMRAASG